MEKRLDEQQRCPVPGGTAAGDARRREEPEAALLLAAVSEQRCCRPGERARPLLAKRPEMAARAALVGAGTCS